jgi:hypothetical protein
MSSSEEHTEIQYPVMTSDDRRKSDLPPLPTHEGTYVQINEVSQLFTHRATPVNEICKPSQSD